MYYAAEDQAGLEAAIMSITTVIEGEFGGACDDTCYGTGCPSGQICVNAACVTNPCDADATLCASSSYCYTDGTSTGMCATVCPDACPAGQSCTTSGCKVDACAGINCPMDQTCQNGQCVATPCAQTCRPQQECIAGVCKDDPCRYITCPSGDSCAPFIGTCSKPVGGSKGSSGNGRSTGCDFGGQGSATLCLFVLLAFGLSLRITRRRRDT
jgi:hypothetical protein